MFAPQILGAVQSADPSFGQAGSIDPNTLLGLIASGGLGQIDGSGRALPGPATSAILGPGAPGPGAWGTSIPAGTAQNAPANSPSLQDASTTQGSATTQDILRAQAAQSYAQAQGLMSQALAQPLPTPAAPTPMQLGLAALFGAADRRFRAGSAFAQGAMLGSRQAYQAALQNAVQRQRLLQAQAGIQARQAAGLTQGADLLDLWSGRDQATDQAALARAQATMNSGQDRAQAAMASGQDRARAAVDSAQIRSSTMQALGQMREQGLVQNSMNLGNLRVLDSIFGYLKNPNLPPQVAGQMYGVAGSLLGGFTGSNPLDGLSESQLQGYFGSDLAQRMMAARSALYSAQAKLANRKP